MRTHAGVWTSILILLSILIFLQPAYYADSCGYVDVPAVESQSGRGSTVRVTICVSPGSGYIRIYGVDRVESDTIVSIFAAYILAQIYSGKRLSASDLSIYFGRNVEDVSGPSAGALLTYAFYSILERGRIGPGISGTGAINIDGSVEAVGGILQKLSALRNIGYRTVFIPAISYTQYSQLLQSQFRGLDVIPLGGIRSVLNISSTAVAQPMMGTVSKDLERVSKIHAEMLRSEITSLMEIYMSRVADRGSQSYRDASTLLNIAEKIPPPEGYPSVNLYYLALISIAQGVVQGDPMGYGASLLDSAVGLYNRSIDILRSAFSDIPRRLSIDQYAVYILLFERALDLASYSSQIRAYISSGDRSALAAVASQLYGRALSIAYWVDILGNISSTGTEIDLADAYRKSQSILNIFRIANHSQNAYNTIVNILGRRVDLEGLRMISSIYTLYNYLRNYSAVLRATTISQIPGGDPGTPSYVETLISRGYMSPQGALVSSLFQDMYGFAIWSLRVVGNSSIALSRSSIPQTLISSLISTSSSASALNMLAIIYTGDASPPRSIEIVGSSQQPMVGGPGGGEVKTSPLYNAISNILAMGSIVAALITLIIALLSIRRRGSQGTASKELS